MVRSKVKISYIANEALRKKTLQKRKKGIMKKINELTTLCGVEACAIVYDSTTENSQPEIFPPSHTEVRRVLNKFSSMPKYNQTNKMQDQRSHLKQRIQKANEKLMKKRRANREKEMAIRIDEFVQTMKLPDDLSLVDLNDITYVANQKIREIDNQLNEIKKKKEEEEMRQMMPMMGDFPASSSSSVFAPQDGAAYGNGGLEMILYGNQRRE